jgi:site-specific DNA-methyltransferase (adenine-specific)
MIEIDNIYNMDCLEGMKQIPDGSVDAVICDLPYGTTSNKWDSIIPLDQLWEAYDRVCKPTAAVVLTASQPFTSMLVMSNVKNFRHEWIWIKNRGSNFANTVREPFKEHEEVVVFSKGHWTYNKQMQPRTGGGADRVKYGFNHVTQSTNYRTFTRPQNESAPELRVPSSWQKFNTEVGSHPTQKPVELFRYLVRTYTNEGDTVLDNCMGSGTTAIACIKEKRHFIGFELNKDYFDKAQKRIKAEQAQLTLF